jgi:hypothetical protein
MNLIGYAFRWCNPPAPRGLHVVGRAALIQTGIELCPCEEGKAMAWGTGKAGVQRAMFQLGVLAEVVHSTAATFLSSSIPPCHCLRDNISFRIDGARVGHSLVSKGKPA